MDFIGREWRERGREKQGGNTDEVGIHREELGRRERGHYFIQIHYMLV